MSFQSFDAAIISPALRAVARHWNEARGTRRMPGWASIKPSAIAAQLPIVWAFKYDRESDTFTGRLAGEQITSIFGKSVRGRPLAEGYPLNEFPAAFARFKRVVSEPAFMRGTGLMFRHFDRYGTGERIMMPLADDGDHADGIFGATEYHVSDTPPSPNTLTAGEIEQWYPLD